MTAKQVAAQIRSEPEDDFSEVLRDSRIDLQAIQERISDDYSD